MLFCDSCKETSYPTFFSVKLKCGHVYCGECKYIRRDLLRNDICVICKAEKTKEKYWINLRYERCKIKL